MSGYVIGLPEQPKVGSVVEIVDGANEGRRYERMTATMWRELNRDGSWGRDVDWSWVWWSVCEDGGGGTGVRVVPADPHPLPWSMSGERDVYVEDAEGRIVCEIEGTDVTVKRTAGQRIVTAVNATSLRGQVRQ